MTSKQLNERIQRHHSVERHTEALNCDRWVASSLLQKAIRRSETEFAWRAAHTLLKLDKAAIWRRLIVIAFEDVGPGDPDAVLETVFLATSSQRRRERGELAALDSIVFRLAEAAKDRSMDYLACAANDHPALAEVRHFCTK